MARIFITLLIALFSCAPAHAQQGIIVDLGKSTLTYRPANYHITDVLDKRRSTTTIGKVREGMITVQGGLAEGLKAFLIGEQPDRTSLPVVVHITQCDIKERAVGAKRQFEIELGIAYYIGASKLIEYKGGAFAQSLSDAEPYIRKLVADNIASNMKEFDAWVVENKSTISAEPSVTVNVTLSPEPEQKHQISYSKGRKLFITDFQGEPDENSPGAAATLSGVGMKIQSSTLRNTTKVDVVLTVYFDKSRSWMKDNGKNVTTLQHEQLHFDITAAKACMLKRQIEQTRFTPENFRDELRAMLEKVQTETGDMQNTYDAETEHGTIIDAQEEWNRSVNELMAEQACYRQ